LHSANDLDIGSVRDYLEKAYNITKVAKEIKNTKVPVTVYIENEKSRHPLIRELLFTVFNNDFVWIPSIPGLTFRQFLSGLDDITTRRLFDELRSLGEQEREVCTGDDIISLPLDTRSHGVRAPVR
jgi:anaerobic glycerol-3-phosphate dehydrogenase